MSARITVSIDLCLNGEQRRRERDRETEIGADTQTDYVSAFCVIQDVTLNGIPKENRSQSLVFSSEHEIVLSPVPTVPSSHLGVYFSTGSKGVDRGRC